MYETVFRFINTGTAPEPQCLSSLAFGIYYLQKLKVSNLLQQFRVEDRGPLMEAMVAKFCSSSELLKPLAGMMMMT